MARLDLLHRRALRGEGEFVIDQKTMPPDSSAERKESTSTSATAGGPSAPKPTQTVGEPQSKKEKAPLGKRLLRSLLVFLGCALLLVLVYRWAGTSTMRGSVQRVYEKEAHYRIEFVDAVGQVHVVENEVVTFPHFKTDTADLQAELHRYSETGDIVDLTTWGFRASFMSLFPNAVGVDFVRSNAVRKKQHVDYITQSVVNELIDQGVLKRGEQSERMRPGLSKAIEKAAAAPAPIEKEDVDSKAPAP